MKARSSDHNMDKVVRGTCMLMCPEREMEMRQKEGLISVLEATREGRGSGRRGGRLTADRRRMVKEFSRSAAGVDLLQPDLLRPPPILKRTINYLLSCVVCENELPFTQIYEFVSDRLRSITQDMTVQQTPPNMCCNILEPIIRFYAYSSYWLCEEPIDRFDPHLNFTQLKDCLKSLLYCYDCEGAREDGLSVSRDQMEALNGLLHLGNVDTLYRLLALNPPSDSQSRIALKMSLAHFCNDYVTFIRLYQRLSPLQLGCVAALHLPKIRRKALLTMNSAYSSANLRYPVAGLTQLLVCVDDAETAEECRHYGLTVDSGGVHFSKGTFDTSVKDRSPKRLEFVDNKLSNCTLPELLLCVEPES